MTGWAVGEASKAETPIYAHTHVAPDAAMGMAAAAGIGAAVTHVVDNAITVVVGETAIAASGEVVGAIGGGGAAGALVPGAGTLIGAAAGLLASGSMQLWFEKRQKADAIQKVDDSLTSVENIIVDGDDEQHGIQKIFERASFRLDF